MLYSRYNSPDSVLNLPYDYGLEIIKKASEKDIERTAWEMWLTFDGQTKNDNPWESYLKKFKEPLKQRVSRTEDEIMQDAENILNMMKRT